MATERVSASVIHTLRATDDILTDFLCGGRDLRTTIADVELLIASLDSVSLDTRNRLQTAWGQLDDCYAIALEDGVPIPGADDPSLRADVLELLDLVRSVLRTGRISAP